MLLLRDPERLGRIMNQPGRPVQIIYAGKAHPRDEPGKGLIRQIVELTHRQEFRRRLVFLEDYDVAVARYLVQGVDVWLNTPLRLQEASGTSGMKATANGVLNLSILDGWWDEAFRPEVGWAIGRREKYDDSNYQDQVEAEALYGLLEQEVVPAFYDRGSDGLPRRWIGRMRASIQTLCRTFTTHRMVGEYTERYYLHAAGHYAQLTANGLARAKALAEWKARLQKNWSRVRVEAVGGDPIKDVQVGGELPVLAKVHLGALTPEEVAVELYMGHVDAAGEIMEAESTMMQAARPEGEGTYIYQASAVTLRGSGLYGYTLRVLPRHPDLTPPFLPGLIVWA
jgi:starch phosphorylase